MNPVQAAIPRPKRWDEAFDPSMTEADVDRILAVPPFSKIDQVKFTNLRGLLRNDTRLVKCRPGDVLVQKGDYGNSAFLILAGTVRVSLGDALAPLLGQQKTAKKTFFEAVAQLWSNPAVPEVRDPRAYTAEAVRLDSASARICLQDVTGLVSKHETAALKAGDIFGEMGALLRTPRSATVFADSEATLLEIRWQGLRDLRVRDEGFRVIIENAYRNNNQEFLKATLFGHLTPQERDAATEAGRFERYGEFEWHKSYAASAGEGRYERLAREPLILREGQPVADLILVMGGFVRVSRNLGHGEQTVAYLGKGHAYGLDELAHNWRCRDEPVMSQRTLRAVGYADLLRLPAGTVERFLLTHLQSRGRLPPLVLPPEKEAVPPPIETQEAKPLTTSLRMSAMKMSFRGGVVVETPPAGPPVGAPSGTSVPAPTGEAPSRPASSHGSVPAGPGGPAAGVGSGLREPPIDSGFLEFLVENRITNGTAAMIVNLDRCTRCDDCVRACASTHEGNPRFVRQGPVYDRHMIATACMHCADPVCMLGCPTGAIHRDPGGGQVVINDRTCIGCSTCANSCPYQAIRMVPIRDAKGNLIVDEASGGAIAKATKCDLCVTQLGGPACQRACPHDALIRVNVPDLSSLARWLHR